MTCHAEVARHKGNLVTKHLTRDNVEQETQKGRMEEKIRWKGPECKTGLKDPYTRRQLCLKIERTTEGIDGKTIELEIVKLAVGISSRMRTIMDWTLWRGWPPPKWKKKQR
jgi:hypothetical protein